MGLFKKIFKPVSKVLDKIVPNEVKPFLPYAAAFAPFMMGPGFGTGFGSGIFKTAAGQQMAARALLGGGANVLGQLSQEGSEGDINLLSAGLGALSGAMTAPGAAETFTGMTTASKLKGAPPGMFDRVMEGRSFLTQAKDLGLTGLAKGSEMFAAGIDKPFSMAGLKAATVPAAVATGDVMEAQQRQIDKQAAIDEALAGAELLEDSGARAAAIRNAMNAYGFFTDEEIEDTIASAGYKAGGRVGFSEGGSDFGGITEAVEKIEKEPKEFLVDKLKVTMKPGQSEMRAIIEAMYNDTDGVMPDDRKKEFYELYAPQMYRNGEMEKSEFEFIQTEILGKEMKAAGGRIGFRDGSSTGSFGLDRYASEMISEGNMLNKDATDFLDKYEDIVKEGKADERLFDLLKEYRTLEDKAEKVEDKFSNYKLQDAAEGIMSAEDIKYYDKKIEDIDKKLDDSDKRLNTLDEEFGSKNIDASEITRTPDFQNWLRLYETDKSKAYKHPYSDIYENILFVKLKGRDKSFFDLEAEAAKAAKFADGGLMNLGGKEMDLRGGGFVPIGKKERADDVPARLSKNEFVMTADAVRAAGGGSVNEGAKRMYKVMNDLEARA